MNFNGWEKLSLVDFDGNLTTTIFSSGCPFRCPYCHNSDLVLRPSELPVIPYEEIMSFLRKRQGVLEAVCISGGEPTLGDDLLIKMKEIKELGYKIKLDSNGFRPQVLKKAVEEGLVDLIAMDIKNSLDKYGLTIGIPDFDTKPIEESIAFLKEGHIPYEFRTTIVDEFHTEEDMEAIGKLIAGSPRYYLQLYIDSENCIERGFHSVSEAKAQRFVEILKPLVPNVKLRGYDD